MSSVILGPKDYDSSKVRWGLVNGSECSPLYLKIELTVT